MEGFTSWGLSYARDLLTSGHHHCTKAGVLFLGFVQVFAFLNDWLGGWVVGWQIGSLG